MRSKLFVPGSRPELFEKAMASAADALSYDLEDAVVPERRDEARAHLAAFLEWLPPASGKLQIVRTNAVDTPGFAKDVAAIVRPSLDVINLPKLESAADVARGVATIAAEEKRRGITRPIGILVNIETPRALRRAAEIASAHPRIMGVQYGLGDLFAPHGIERHEAAIAPVRLAVKLAAAEAGVACYDTAFTNVADKAGYEAEAQAARRVGYTGKSCIHPTQIAIANAVFAPSAAELAWARKVLAAIEDPANRGKGAFVIDGKMVDEPFFVQARATLALAASLGLQR